MTETQPIEEEARPPDASADCRGTRRRAPRLLLLAALLHGLAYLLLLPPWMGEDEPWHVEYVHHVAAGHMPWGGRAVSTADLKEYSPSQAQVLRELGGLEREEVLGTQRAILDSMRAQHFWERVDWASWGGGAEDFDQVSPYFTATHQPPLYYVVVGLCGRLFGGGDVLREMWLGRCLSLFTYLAVVLAAYALAVRVCEDRAVALLAGFIVAWWPMHARQAAVVNNDALVKVFSSWTLVLTLDIARLGLARRRVAWALLLAAAGLAVKSTAAGVLVPLGLVLAWRAGRGRGLGGRRALGALAVLAAALLVPLVYLLSNNPAIPLSLALFIERLQAAVQPAFREEFARTTVGAFNWYSRDLPALLHDAVRIGLALSGVGLLLALVRSRPELRRGLTLLCVLAVLAQLALVFLRGTAAGRYALPIVPAFGLLVSVGVLVPLPRRWRAGAAVLVGAALVAFDGYFLWSGLVWNQYGVWGS
jgi:hypothetical protein